MKFTIFDEFSIHVFQSFTISYHKILLRIWNLTKDLDSCTVNDKTFEEEIFGIY